MMSRSVVRIAFDTAWKVIGGSCASVICCRDAPCKRKLSILRDALHALDPVFAVDLFQLISLNRVFNFLPRFRLAGRSAPEPATILLEAANASPGGEAVHAGDHGTGGGGPSIVREVARNPATVA
jgi:hypothetical protein